MFEDFRAIRNGCVEVSGDLVNGEARVVVAELASAGVLCALVALPRSRSRSRDLMIEDLRKS